MNTKFTGFTLIELMLAMTFISILLLTIALTIVQIANIYNHGGILKEMNQTSRSITEELDGAFRSSSKFSTDPAANRYVSNTWGGRLCSGQYSYIWNYGKSLSDQSTNRNQYSGFNNDGNIIKTAGSPTRSEISFVKAPDSGGSYCVPGSGGKYPLINPTGAIELLRSGDHGLVLHSFRIDSAPTAQDSLSGQQLYKITFNLGTHDVTALDSTLTACKAPGQTGADPNYCAVEQFTIVLRVVSGVN